MRIHTDKLTVTDIQNALQSEKNAGRIARDVTFKTLTTHNSRDYAYSFEVQLEAYTKVDGDGRRYANSGSYGAATAYTATHDEWGWLLSVLFAKDEYMRVGSKSYPIYRDDDDFHEKTGLSYHPGALRGNLTYPDVEHGSDPYPFTTSRTAGQAGQKGKGRSNGDDLPSYIYHEAINNPGKLIRGYVRFVPRTLADVPA